MRNIPKRAEVGEMELIKSPAKSEPPKVKELRKQIEILDTQIATLEAQRDGFQSQLDLLLADQIDYAEEYNKLMTEIRKVKDDHRKTLGTLGDVVRKFDLDKEFPYSLAKAKCIDGCGADILIADQKNNSMVFWEQKASATGYSPSYTQLERWLRKGIEGKGINFVYLTSKLHPDGIKFDKKIWECTA